MVTTPDRSARRRSATIGALALTVLALNVSPAAAGSDKHINTDGGSAHFYASGTEQVFVADIRADGEGVRAQLRWKGRMVSVDDSTAPATGTNTRSSSFASAPTSSFGCVTRTTATTCGALAGSAPRLQRRNRAVARYRE